MEQLAVSFGRYPHTVELFGEPIDLGDGQSFVLEPFARGGGFPQMLRELRYDVFEFPIVSYLVARERGAELSALPLFVTRQFVHSSLEWNLATGVREPRDLEGRRAGVRYYGITDGTWARGVLSESFGVDLDRVTWVTSAPETVDGAVLPSNVEQRPGAPLGGMLCQGELAAIAGGVSVETADPGIGPMFADLVGEEERWFSATGVVPILHLVAVKDSSVAAHPFLAERITELLTGSKDRALARIADGNDLSPAEARLASLGALMGGDPLPYGVEANRRPLEMLIRFCVEQHVLSQEPALESLFVGS